MIQTKTQVSPLYYLIFFFEDQYIVQQKMLTQKQEYVNFCFTLSVFGRKKKLQIENTSNREAEHFDLTLNAMKLHCMKI